MKKIIILLILLIISPVAHSDSWAPAETMAAIDSTGKYVLKTHPGKDLDSVWGFGGTKGGKKEKDNKNAKFEVYRFNEKTKNYDFLTEFISNNPISPVFIYISKYGNITTIDNWHNMGIGKVITIYTFRGTIKNSFSLNDIFDEKDVKEIPESTSSLHWRCSKPYKHRNKDIIEVYGFNDEIIKVNPNKGVITKGKAIGICT